MAHDHSHDHGGAGHDHAGHDHAAELKRTPVRRLVGALALTTVVFFAELIGGYLTNSVALLADAGHMLSDVAALGLALWASWLATRRPSERFGGRFTFGFARAEVLAALANALTLVAVGGAVIVEALSRLKSPEAVESGPMLVIAIIGLLANLGSAALLHGGTSLNERGAFLHVVTDAVGSVGVIIAALVIRWTGWLLADPLLSLAISLLIVWSAWSLLKPTLTVLMEAAPPDTDPAGILAALRGIDGVVGVHDLHLWTVASGFPALSAHLVVKGDFGRVTVEKTLIDARHRLEHDFGISHVTLQLEPLGFVAIETLEIAAQ